MDDPRAQKVLYWIIGLLLAGLAIYMLFFDSKGNMGSRFPEQGDPCGTYEDRHRF